MDPSGDREHQDRRHSGEGLSQRQALSYIYWDLFRRFWWLVGLCTIVLDIPIYPTLSILITLDREFASLLTGIPLSPTLANFQRTLGYEEQFTSLFFLLALLFTPLYILRLLSHPRFGLVWPTLAALPIRRPTLARGLWMGILWVYLLQTALACILLAAAGGGRFPFPFPAFFSAIVLVPSAIIGPGLLRASFQRGMGLRAKWRTQMLEKLAVFGWPALSFLFAYRMLAVPFFEPSDWSTLHAISPALARAASRLVACDSPFVLANVFFFTLSAAALVLSLVYPEDVMGWSRRGRQGHDARRHRSAYRIGRPRNTWHLVSPAVSLLVKGPPGPTGGGWFVHLFPLLFLAQGAFLATMPFPFPFLSVPFGMAYAIQFEVAVSQVRALRSLPLSIPAIAVMILALPLFNVSLYLILLALLMVCIWTSVWLVNLPLQIVFGCVFAHLMCLTFKARMWKSFVAILMVGLIGLFFALGALIELNAAFLPPFAAWCTTLTAAGIAAVIGWLSLTQLIRRSSLLYRNPRKNIKASYGS